MLLAGLEPADRVRRKLGKVPCARPLAPHAASMQLSMSNEYTRARGGRGRGRGRGPPTDSADRRVLPCVQVQDYPMLARSGCMSVEGRDDACEWGEMVEAMANLGIGTTEQEQIFDITARPLVLTKAEGDRPA